MQLVGDVSYYNYGIDNEYSSISTSFLYSFSYTNYFDTDVGGSAAGPTDAHVGITLVHMAMFETTSGSPQSMPFSFTQSGCNRGTVSSPVTVGSSTCTYTADSTYSLVPTWPQPSLDSACYC